MPSASRVRWAKFRVIAVSLVAIAILLTLLYLLTGGTLLEPKVTVYLYIPDATGLSHKAPVRVNGLDVGTVDTVTLTGSKNPLRIVKLTILVGRDKLDSITSDAQSQISTDTLVGDKFVDIASGTATGHVMPYGELNFKANADITRTIDLVDLEKQLRVVDSTFADLQNGSTPLGQFVQTDTVYVDLRKKFITMQAIIDDATRTTSIAGSLLYTDAMYLKMRAPLVELDRTLAQLQSGQGSLGKFLHDPAQYQQAVAQVQDLRQSIAGARANEWIASDTMYDAWNHTLSSLIQQVDEINAMPMFATTEMYDNLAGAAAEMGKSMKDFREDPRKFLRLKIF